MEIARTVPFVVVVFLSVERKKEGGLGLLQQQASPSKLGSIYWGSLILIPNGWLRVRGKIKQAKHYTYGVVESVMS